MNPLLFLSLSLSLTRGMFTFNLPLERSWLAPRIVSVFLLVLRLDCGALLSTVCKEQIVVPLLVFSCVELGFLPLEAQSLDRSNSFFVVNCL